MTDLHASCTGYGVYIGDTIAESEGADVHGPACQRWANDCVSGLHLSELCVAIYSLRGSQATPCTLCVCSLSANTHSPDNQLKHHGRGRKRGKGERGSGQADTNQKPPSISSRCYQSNQQ